MELPRRWEKMEIKGEVYSPRTGFYLKIFKFPLVTLWLKIQTISTFSLELILKAEQMTSLYTPQVRINPYFKNYRNGVS